MAVLTDDTAILRVEYETDELLPAVDVADMLMEVAAAFERYSKRRYRSASLRLAVTRVEVSSLLADLVVVGLATAQAVLEHPEALYGFIGFIADTLSIAKGLKPGKLKSSDVRMIDALQKPVAQRGAQQVNLFIVGDGNVVSIDRDAIQLIEARREQQRSATALEPAEGPLAIEVGQPLKPRLQTLDGKYGTVFDVKGEWYVRLEGEGGVLNPLLLVPDVTVLDGHSYLFDGVWDDRRYRISVARPLR